MVIIGSFHELSEGAMKLAGREASLKRARGGTLFYLCTRLMTNVGVSDVVTFD